MVKFLLLTPENSYSKITETTQRELAGFSPNVKGDYILRLKLARKVEISYGAKKSIRLGPGHYLYFGSARGTGGLRSRVLRHLNKEAVVHWHIDKLKEFTTTREVFILPGEAKLECRLADYFGRMKNFSRIPGFGCSDCGCPSHLIMSKSEIDTGKVLINFFREQKRLSTSLTGQDKS